VLAHSSNLFWHLCLFVVFSTDLLSVVRMHRASFLNGHPGPFMPSINETQGILIGTRFTNPSDPMQCFRAQKCASIREAFDAFGTMRINFVLTDPIVNWTDVQNELAFRGAYSIGFFGRANCDRVCEVA
jgi:hypothetical protein